MGLPLGNPERAFSRDAKPGFPGASEKFPVGLGAWWGLEYECWVGPGRMVGGAPKGWKEQAGELSGG